MRVLKLSLTALFLLTMVAYSNTDSLIIQSRLELDQSVDRWNETEIRQVRAKFERLMKLTDKKWLIHYYIAYADYNLGLMLTKKSPEEAEKMIDDGIAHLLKSVEEKRDFAEGFAMLSSCYGIKIGFSPMKAIYLGPRSGVAISKAKELAPENPRVRLIDGIGAFHRPSMFGGGADIAKSELEKAAKFYKLFKVESALLPDWGYEGPYIWLGRIALESDELNDAKTYFDQALAIKPEHGLVKYVLLPKLAEAQQKAEKVSSK